MMRRGLGRALCVGATVPRCHSARRWQGDTTTGPHAYLRDYARHAQDETTPIATAQDVVGDWTTKLQRELLLEHDPLGGMAHKDYFRDPATGYTPQYAPRNFARGGELGYGHPLSIVHHTLAEAERNWLQHDVSTLQEQARHARATARELPPSRSTSDGSAVEGFLSRLVPHDRFRTHVTADPSTAVLDQLALSTGLTEETLRRQVVVDRFQHARTTAPRSHTADTLPSDELASVVLAQHRQLTDDAVDEQLKIEHGQRAKERHDFAVLQRTSRVTFEGYDMDRFAAQQKGTPHGALQLPPLTPPSSMAEAQRRVREGATPEPVTVMQQVYARNTVSAEPQLGEGLTESVVDSLHAAAQSRRRSEEQARAQRFGLGRQGALVQDAGPDRRVVRRNQNDERVMDALHFRSNAYRLTPTDEHVNPYTRRETEHGVGHLLTNRFDLERREQRIGRGAQDLTERSTIHYGVQLQQTVDEFVHRRRNARGERPLDYFRPFPHFRAQRLQRMYSDLEGFSLMRQRPELLEWELFTRYRAHHQQRRALALLHGLEPLRNETAQERDARRLALDHLCESTPFDPRFLSLHDDEAVVEVETLRACFGVYLLPSPSVVRAVLEGGGSLGLHLHHLVDDLGTPDTREHVLSARYLTRLLLFEAYQHRLSRGFVGETVGRAPEPVMAHAQPSEVLRWFTGAERAMYAEYVQGETERQAARWRDMRRGRRLITCGAEAGQYGEVVAQGAPVRVIDLRHAEHGGVTTAALKACTTTGTTVMLQNEPYVVVPHSERDVVPVSVRLESGSTVVMTGEQLGRCPLEVAASASYNHALDFGVANYAYNRGNYIETQDVLWERATAQGVEGWSPATHADRLQAGMPVRARRVLNRAESDGTNSCSRITGGLERAHVVRYQAQPFFNPEPRLVTVCFAADHTEAEVYLSEVVVWQRRYHGPDRTVGEESHRYHGNGVYRYVDVADPDQVKSRAAREPHFLDSYLVATTKSRDGRGGAGTDFGTMKQITELDQWTRLDTRRAENYRPLGISHRKDYVRQNYYHRYTPWEWIAVQEADQPLLAESIRQDDLGVSHTFALHRFWRYKARPHGYLRHFEHEVRDLFQYVDGVTPWRQAQKIRTYWEVRQHHPMPQFNRPEVALHRNTAALLPTQLWETDKKTGKVKAVKDSVRDYKTKTPLPKWVQL